MSTDKQKINVGLLPEQTEDYSQYEENELNWGRIIFAAVIAVIIAIFSIYYLLTSEEAPTNELKTASSMAQAPNNAHTKIPATRDPEKVQLTPQAATQATKPEPLKKVVEANLPKSVDVPLVKKIAKKEETPLIQQAPTNTKVEANKHIAKAHQKTPYMHQVKAVSPVEILDTRIKKAQLSSNLVKGLPVDTLSSEVLMSEEGIIRVHLYTEMENLRGQNLFHHWYLNGEKQARVRIPVNHKTQRSSSSKFINKQMLGKWTVQVLDEQGKAYIEVNFEVI
ncbi:MAG: hypothetical protein ACJAWS_000158 [Oleiphilaceae bacterium]|jgi:hypothetical protein